MGNSTLLPSKKRQLTYFPSKKRGAGVCLKEPMNNFNINKRVNPKGLKKDEYDVIIIGAGIGGLTCGSYLAKAGMKVLIVEKNPKPGGYCVSFIDDLQNQFPHQSKEIASFFKFINPSNFIALYAQLKNKTFKDVLDEFFKDAQLKSLLSILLGNMGLPSSKASALATIALYREHIFDGGYYPKGGMQALPDALVKKFRELGGRVLLSTTTDKIKIAEGKVKGVIINKNHLLPSKYVVSNCDARQTFLKLIGKKYLNSSFIGKLEKLTPSISAFLVFLGINKKLNKEIQKCSGLWYFPSDNVDKYWAFVQHNFSNANVFCMFPSFHDTTLAPANSETITLMVVAPFKTKIYWETNKSVFTNKLIKRAEGVIPSLSSHIVIKEVATPFTLHNYTLNDKGAIRGWQPTICQTAADLVPPNSFI
ncbi:MAG: NAD(P)/FAD-dependent oxidoreductase, partial [Nitrospirae bacterium]|nr:NAD(P)/FAD-dependent oxidoreductase [Nitrospirota bacterium]